jgi:hypothetical protein
VIFLGPSPGGEKEVNRQPIKLNTIKPLWDQPYLEPTEKWSHGFKVSFKPIVENIFQRNFDDAGKLIARINLDWIQNPNSDDVGYYYMWLGSKHIMPVITECNPFVVIPMDRNTYDIFQIVLAENDWQISGINTQKIDLPISQGKTNTRVHREIRYFFAKRNGMEIVVIKSLQHPARIYEVEYAKRIGQAIRKVIEDNDLRRQ